MGGAAGERGGTLRGNRGDSDPAEPAESAGEGTVGIGTGDERIAENEEVGGTDAREARGGGDNEAEASKEVRGVDWDEEEAEETQETEALVKGGEMEENTNDSLPPATVSECREERINPV